MIGRLIGRLDLYILVPVCYLVFIGVIVQYSILNKTTGIEIDLNMSSQLIAITLGLVMLILLSFTRLWNRLGMLRLAYVVILLLLILVYAIGVEVNGSQRWLNVASFQLQPTELAKLVLVLYLARLFDSKEATVNKLKTVLHSLLTAIVPAALVILQPDLGSAIVLLVVWVAILFASRLKLSRFTFLMVALLAGVVVLIPFMAEYQQERLVSYFNPERDLSGSGYNVLQAGIAIGSGGLLGVGLDAGTQSQLNFLPSQHTDFIFAVTAEKLGLLGSLSIIAALMMLLGRLLYLAWVTNSQSERGVLTGIIAILFFQSFVNIGMNVGLVPVTGLPLPFLSYGGTFMVVSLAMIGICLSISNDRKQHI